MKNILYLIPSLTNSGGMERVLTDKVNYLIKTGKYNITIATTDMQKEAKPFYTLDGNVRVVHFEIFFNLVFELSLVTKINKSKKLLHAYKEKLSTFIKDNNIDICISMGAKELEFFSPLEVPVVKIFESHFNPTVRSSFISDHKGNSFLWKVLGKYRDWQYRQQTKKLDKVVVLTKSAKVEWEKTHKNIHLINNPSPFSTVLSGLRGSEFKRAIAIGRLEDQKGFDLLIQSWKIVHLKFPDWKLDIFGEGSKKEILQELIFENNLESAIKLRGVTRDVQNELMTSDFYIMSSRYEGLPMVLLESIACGLPIVSFNCPTGPAEIIENDDCGLLCVDGDVKNLAQNIIKLIENSDLREIMSAKAIEKSTKYSIDKIMLQWEKLFSDLISH